VHIPSDMQDIVYPCKNLHITRPKALTYARARAILYVDFAAHDPARAPPLGKAVRGRVSFCLNPPRKNMMEEDLTKRVERLEKKVKKLEKQTLPETIVPIYVVPNMFPAVPYYIWRYPYLYPSNTGITVTWSEY
jgi:hypothetical protein